MDDKFKTSAGPLSEPGGKYEGPSSSGSSHGVDLAPTGIATEKAVREQLKTTQQIRGEFSLPEGK